MSFRRRDRFAALVARQLDLLRQDEPELWEAMEAALRAYERAGRDEAEELYGDYLLAVEACADRLGEIRDGFARTLDGDAADEYRAAFDRAALRRWKALSTEL